MYYYKFEWELSAFSKVLTEWSLKGVVAYESFSLQSLSDKSNVVSQCWS